MKRIVVVALLVGMVSSAFADRIIPIPVDRIVSLAPNITEILFAIGAGHEVKGVSAFSNYPKRAKQLPIVASSYGLDVERIVQLKPQIAIAWEEGNPSQELSQLRSLHIPVYLARLGTMTQIATTMLRLGQIAGTLPKAEQVASQFVSRYQNLRARYEGQKPVSVFYALSNQPLMTLSGRTLQGHMIHDCGGVNIFAHTMGTAPEVNIASVLAKQPQVIIISQPEGSKRDLTAFWKKYNQIPAVKHGQIYSIDSDLIDRAGPRSVDGMQQLCTAIADARKNEEK